MSKPLILIVEDHPTVSLVFSQALRDVKYDVEIIADGSQALERLQTITPDLLLLDVHLPEVSGEEILHQVRQDKRFDDTNITLMTADVLAHDRLSQENEHILLKPISIHTLRKLVSGLNGNGTA